MTTTRLSMFQPAYGQQADIETAVNDNLDILDAAIGAQVYTASTRPASGYSGKPIFETDTNAVLVWQGSAWRYATPPVAASLATVTGTHAGLLGVQTSDNTLKRWTGSTWSNLVVPASAASGEGAVYERAAVQSCANNTDTFVDFDTAVKETGYITKSTSTGSVFTINVTGWYTMTAQARWEDNNTGRRDVHIVNGANNNIRYATCRTSATQNGATGTGTGEPCASVSYYLTAGDTVKIMVNQNRGGSLNLEAAAFGPRTRVSFLYGGA